MFQFLIGRLKTKDAIMVPIRTATFQFLIGRLKTKGDTNMAASKLGFNSS